MILAVTSRSSGVPTSVSATSAEAFLGTVACRPLATARAVTSTEPTMIVRATFLAGSLPWRPSANSAPQSPDAMATGTAMARPSAHMSWVHGKAKTRSFHSFSITRPTVPISRPPTAPNHSGFSLSLVRASSSIRIALPR